ncbi:MAG: hypothetical protein Q8P18_25510 [Pseudomonadota bacterium]|nr:hypothetical protein [Pseudomonadota bacterium]
MTHPAASRATPTVRDLLRDRFGAFRARTEMTRLRLAEDGR